MLRNKKQEGKAENTLQNSEDRYRNLFQSSRDAVMTLEPPLWSFTSGNKAAIELFKARDEANFLSYEPWKLSPERQPDGRVSTEKAKEMIEEAMRVGFNLFEWTHKRLNGEEFFTEVSLSRIGHGNKAFLHAIVRDITERRRAEKAILESEARFRNIVFLSPDAIIVTDAKGKIEYINPSAGIVFNRKVENLIGTVFGLAILDGKSTEIDIFRPGKDPGVGGMRVVSTEWMNKKAHLIIIRDITERKKTEAKIYQMAFYDSLTGLPNRKLLSDRLDIALAHAQRNQKKVGIAMIDLDNFKDVNDTLGHNVGDIFLKATAERLSAALRKSDTVARFGGDEFVLILPDMEAIEYAIQVAQKIIDKFRKPFLIGIHQLVVTTSIGIAVYPNDGINEGILLKNADIAMYQAKQAGRAQYQLCKKD